MSRIVTVTACCLILSLTTFVGSLRADNEGQADLDKATELKVTSKSLSDLDQVIDLCESALKKGLDEGNQKFAKNLISSTLYQRASALAAGIFADTQDRRWPFYRQEALRDLNESLEYDANSTDAHLLIGRLEALPGGNARRGRKAVEKAIELLGDDKAKQSEALVLKAQLSENDDDRMAALNQAIEVDPKNAQAHQLRAAMFFGKGDVDKAIADMEQVLAQSPDNLEARAALSEALLSVKEFAKAMEQAEATIKQAPDSPIGYLLKAQIHMAQEQLKEATEALGKVLEAEPNQPLALLMRARVYMADDKPNEALADVNRVLTTNPDRPPVQAILLRSMINADLQKFDEAIVDMQMLVDNAPQNIEWQLQLAAFYNASGRPRKAIQLYDAMLEDDSENWRARRGRADASLSIGKHAEAIADYKAVVQVQPEHSGILNNYAWVLATSPVDELRDSKRAIELATKACEVTEFKEAHILSTLAAAYAESGDFETAIKWSTKAVELGEGETRDQLQKELESYKEKKPWRELQETKEKPDVKAGRRDRIAA